MTVWGMVMTVSGMCRPQDSGMFSSMEIIASASLAFVCSPYDRAERPMR